MYKNLFWKVWIILGIVFCVGLKKIISLVLRLRFLIELIICKIVLVMLRGCNISFEYRDVVLFVIKLLI